MRAPMPGFQTQLGVRGGGMVNFEPNFSEVSESPSNSFPAGINQTPPLGHMGNDDAEMQKALLASMGVQLVSHEDPSQPSGGQQPTQQHNPSEEFDPDDHDSELQRILEMSKQQQP